jgi:hypothetical protein
MLKPNFLGELGEGSGQSVLKSFRLCFNGVTHFFNSRMDAVILDPVLSYSSFVGKDLITVRSLAEACLDCFLLQNEPVDYICVVASSKTYPRGALRIWMLGHDMARYPVARRSREVTILFETAVKSSRLIGRVQRLSAFNPMGLANVGPVRFT